MANNSSFMRLPPELRIDIYERVLQFDCPLRRIKPMTELDGTLMDDLRQYVRGGPADISILFACRTTYLEALPILYKQSITSLCHHDVCVWLRERGFTRCDRELLTHISIVDWVECGPWTKCKGCSKELYGFLGGFNLPSFPKLKTMTLDLEGFRGGYTRLRESLLKQGVDVSFDFTAVGCLRLRYPGTGPTIDLRLTTIAAVWVHFVAHPPSPLELFTFYRIPLQLQDMNEHFVTYVKRVFWSYRDWVASGRHPSFLVKAPRGIDMSLLEPGNHGPLAYEKLTDKLLQVFESCCRTG